MNDMLLWIGRIAGVVGALLCVAAIAIRIAGQYWIAGFQVGTLLLAGTAAMIGACVCFLWVLTARPSAQR
jgi:hypothetical protein